MPWVWTVGSGAGDLSLLGIGAQFMLVSVCLSALWGVAYRGSLSPEAEMGRGFLVFANVLHAAFLIYGSTLLVAHPHDLMEVEAGRLVLTIFPLMSAVQVLFGMARLRELRAIRAAGEAELG